MGIKQEKVRQQNNAAKKTETYYNTVLGSDLASPVMCPDTLGDTGRQLDKFCVTDRKECVAKNLGVNLTPSQLFTKAGLSRKVKK